MARDLHAWLEATLSRGDASRHRAVAPRVQVPLRREGLALELIEGAHGPRTVVGVRKIGVAKVPTDEAAVPQDEHLGRATVDPSEAAQDACRALAYVWSLAHAQQMAVQPVHPGQLECQREARAGLEEVLNKRGQLGALRRHARFELHERLAVSHLEDCDEARAPAFQPIA